MKKTLAILLALLAAASISLAACDGNEKTPLGDDDPDVDILDNSDNEDSSTSDSSDSSDTSDTGSNNNSNNNNEITNNGYTEKNDTVYSGVKIYLRKSANDNDKSSKHVEFGDQLTRISTNGTWSKVKISGDDTTYYLRNKYLSTDGSNFTFTSVEETLKLTIADPTPNAISFFTSPHKIGGLGDPDYFQNVVCAAGIKKNNIVGEYTMTLVGYNNNWAKIEFKGTIEISSNNKKSYSETTTLYVIADAFKRGDITGAESIFASSSGGNNGDIL